MGIRWDVGMELWLVPQRYWEEAEPEECRLAEELSETEERHLYVFHKGYGHEVYVPSERCFQSKEAAIRAAKLLRELQALKEEDEAEWLTDRIIKRQFADSPRSIERERRGYTYTGYMVIPSHHAKKGSLGRVPIDSFGRPTGVYWDKRSAEKFLQAEKRCPYSIVKVHVTPITVVTAD